MRKGRRLLIASDLMISPLSVVRCQWSVVSCCVKPRPEAFFDIPISAGYWNQKRSITSTTDNGLLTTDNEQPHHSTGNPSRRIICSAFVVGHGPECNL